MNIMKYLERRLPFDGKFMVTRPEVQEVKGSASVLQLTNQLTLVENSIKGLLLIRDHLRDVLDAEEVVAADPTEEVNDKIAEALDEQD